jgi:hypothetical protein
MPVLLIGDSVKMLIAIEKVAGVSVTSSTIVKGALVEAKANWLALPFTKDKNLITGADSGDLEELVSEFSNIVDTYNPDVIEAA